MKKTKVITILMIISLCLNMCCGFNLFPKLLSRLNGTSAIENYKYDAKLSTFKLNKAETDIVFLGDSITAYIDWNEFFPSYNLLNRGIEGDTWGGVLRRLDEVTGRNPHFIVLMIGINDVVAGSSSSEILQKARQTISTIENNMPNTQVILCDVLPSPQCSLDVIREVNYGLEDISEGNDKISYLTLMELYVNSDGKANNELFSGDGIHLNGSGYSIWVEELRKVLS